MEFSSLDGGQEDIYSGISFVEKTEIFVMQDAFSFYHKHSIKYSGNNVKLGQTSRRLSQVTTTIG